MSLEVQGVDKEFPTREGTLIALAGIDLSVADGEFLCLIGPSGCGKTTLLLLLAGLEFPTRGRVLAGGEPIAGTDPSLVLIFQEAALFPWLNVQDNIGFGLRAKGVPGQEQAATTRRLLAMVHLESFRRSWVHELSGGMRQRVALARALAVDPRVLLMDEPFGALDAITRERLHDELQEVWANTGKTIVFVTHNVREAIVLGDRVLVFSPRPGRILAEHKILLPRPRRVDDVATLEIAHRIGRDLRPEGGDLA